MSSTRLCESLVLPEDRKKSGNLSEVRASKAHKKRRGSPPRRLRPLSERFFEDLTYSAPAVLISAAAHIVALIIMALIIVQLHTVPPDRIIESVWGQRVQEPPPGISSVVGNPMMPITIEPLKTEETQKVQARVGSKSPSEEADELIKPVDVDNLFANRSGPLRSEIMQGLGNHQQIEAAITGGLKWLQRQQQSDGRWELHKGYPDPALETLRTDAGATALALLAFLGAGQTGQHGDYQQTVAGGLNWLMIQQRDNGDFHDRLELGLQTSFYTQAMATIAMCESYSLTSNGEHRAAAVKGVEFLLAAQHPLNGGWRYRVQREESEGDLSVTGWALMALHTARAAGLEVPEEAFARANIFLDSVQDQTPTRYKYQPNMNAGSHRPAMTAEGLVCRQWLGWERDDRRLVNGVNYLASPTLRPNWSNGSRNIYGWYYTSHVLHNYGGRLWTAWYNHTSGEILRRQARTGSIRPGQEVRGSWHPTKPEGSPWEYGDQAGRLYVTCMSLLVLESPFRHASVYGEE